MNSVLIDIEKLEENVGQIEGLPANPRKFKRKEVEKIAKSLQETPELAEMRPLLVFPHGGKFVVIGGNLRLNGFKILGVSECPCVVIDENMPIQKLKEIIIKDNGSFGEWNIDSLNHDWVDIPLIDWGIPETIFETEKKEIEKLNDYDIQEEDDDSVDFEKCPKCGFQWKK